MEVQNSAESQSSDQSQPIQEMDGVGGSKMVGGLVDVVVGGAAGGGGGLEVELGSGGGGVEVELGSGGGGAEMVKKKRGRPPRGQAKSPPAKMNKEEDEDVCFICFDGGSLVLCDRRGCPKAYHPACVKRDEAFFRSKAKWNCGWHICSICQKAAHHMCYTCTYSLCKGCIKKADYVCVKGDKGFCTVCMKTIMLIENNGQEKDEKAQVDFDDKTSWEYLFKVYWVYLKGKLSLTLDELTQAKNPWEGASTAASVSPSTCAPNGGNDLESITPDTSLRNLEASESKRRKTDEQISIPHKETVSTKKLGTDESSSVVACKDWATKELLDFVAHMKNGDASVLSQFDVQELMLEYIKRNNLRDPRKKSQIICDSRLKTLFGKPRVGHFEMLKLLEFQFFIKEDLPKSRINSIARQLDPDWNSDNMLTVGKDKKRRNHRKGEERAPQNKLDEYAAIDVHNMNLVYLRRKLMENLIVDSEEFHGKVVGSIVRIRISGSDQKHDMYRLVQVVGTSKVDVPYKIGDKSTDVVLEVLNLDKKETVSIDTISNQDLSEDECRRLRQSIRCGLVKRFTVGEIQEKAVALQSVRLNDWMEAEILRLNNLRDRASEKGHKKGLRECVEKLQLLKTPEERERRLREIPEVHSDPKMNPDYETDDTEEYFNKEHGEHMKPKHSGVTRKNTSSPKKRKQFSNNVGSRSWKNEQPRHVSITGEEGSTKATGRINTGKDAHASSSSLGRPQNQVGCNGSTITNWNHRITGNSSLLNTASETATSSYSMKNTPTSNDSEIDKVWHYRDPSGKVQGPFCMVQLQKWSTTGYFPADMRIWTNRENESLLLNDVLKEQSHNARLSENKTATDKVGIRIEGLTVCTANPLSTVHVTPQNSVNLEKLSDSHGSLGQSSVQNWSANGYPPSFAKSNESTGQFNTPDMASPTPVGNNADIKHVSSVFDIADAALVDLPSPTPKKMSHEDEKVQNAGDKEQSMPSSEILVQDARNPTSWSSAPRLDVGGAQLPKTADEWGGYSPTQVKHEEWHSGGVSALEVEGDHVATTTSNFEQIIHSSSPPSSQPACSYLPQWHGVRETIEFSTLAEESVSDLLAEVDAMESQNGLPSPTSRRNNFVEDLFNGSFEEFSPTPDQGARSDGFSSSGADIQLPYQSTTITTTAAIDEHAVGTSQGNNSNVFDFVKRSTDLQQSFVCPETKSEDMPFKWPEMQRETIFKDIRVGSHSSELQLPPQDMIDVNNSTKAEADEGEREIKTSYVQVEEKAVQMRPDHSASETSHDRAGVSSEHKEGECAQPTTTKSKDASPELVLQVSQSMEPKGRNDHIRAGDGMAQSAKVDAVGEGRKPGGDVRAKEEDGEFIHMEAAGPPPPLSLTIGLDKVYPRRVGSEAMQGNMNNSGRPAQEITTRANPHSNTSRGGNVGWDPHRYNNNSPRERSYKVEDSGYSRSSKSSWGRQSSFGSGGPGGGGGSGGGYSRPPPKGQRVCKFYESGRCKKGASCNYWHP